MDTKLAYERKLEACLREWRSEIELLQSKANSVKADAKPTHFQRILGLLIKYEAAVESLRLLKRVDGVDFTDRADAVGDKIEDLRRAAARTWSYF